MSKASSYYNFVRTAVDKVVTAGKERNTDDVDELLLKLSAVVPKYGLSLQQLNQLLDIALDPRDTFKFSHKRKLIQLMQSYEMIDIGTVLRILSAFQVETHLNSNTVVSRSVQVGLSKWLVVNFFNLELDQSYLRLLPFIFNLLSVGYIRSNVSTFICYLLEVATLLDTDFDYTRFFNKYKLEYLLDLISRDSNVSLLVSCANRLLQKSYSGKLSTYSYRLQHSIKGLKNQRYGTIDFDHLTSSLEMKLNHERLLTGVSLDNLLQENETLQQFQANAQIYYQMVTSLNAKISKSLPSLDYINIQSYCADVTDTTDRLASYLRYLATEKHQSPPKLSPDLAKLLGNPSTVSTESPLLNMLLKIGTAELDFALSKLLVSGANTKDSELILNGTLQVVKNSFELPNTIKSMLSKDTTLPILSKFIPYYPLTTWKEFRPVFEHVHDYYGLFNLLDNWIIRLKLDSSDNTEHWTCLNKVIEQLSDKLSFTQLIRLVKITHEIPFEFVLASNLVLKPTLVSAAYFSENPILIDTICDHITFCKQYYGEFGSSLIASSKMNAANEMSSEQFSQLKEIHNSYVMDLCNIIWRDKAFDKNDRSTAKGFLLPDQFIAKLLKSRFYYFESNRDTDSGLIKRSYDIFYAPAFASIITGIIRTIEDEQDVSTRLSGPLNRDEFDYLAESDSGWLNDRRLLTSYDNLRITILDRLSSIGFVGLSDLLFSSLKSLSRVKNDMTHKAA